MTQGDGPFDLTQEEGSFDLPGLKIFLSYRRQNMYIIMSCTQCDIKKKTKIRNKQSEVTVEK